MDHIPAQAEIESLFALQAELWNRHDVQAYAALWVEDCDFVNVVGMHRNGRAELAAELEYLHAGRFRDTRIRIERSHVRFLAPEIATANVWWAMEGDPGQPGFPTVDGRRQGIFTHVLKHTSEGWRLVASQNTDSLPIPDFLHPPEPAAAGTAR